MRVLAAIVAPPHLALGGAARAAEQLSLALAAHCDITVASMMAPQLSAKSGLRRVAVRTRLPPGIPWRRIPNRYRTPFYRSDIPRLVASGDYDLVHLHNPMPALAMAAIARACRRTGVPYLISTHGFNEIANGERVYRFDVARRAAWRLLVSRPLERVVRGAASVLGLSPADRDILRAMGFSGSFALAPNGVPRPAPADPTRDAAIHAAYGIPAPQPGTITGMFLANHTPNKGLPVLLEAFAGLDRPFTLIVGGETRPEIDYALAGRLRRPDQRIIVTGRLGDGDLGALYRRADLFVFPTLADTFPLVVLEAMAHGLPVIASNVGGIPYQIDEGCGRLVEAGDVASLRDAVEAIASNPEARRAMGARAKARAASVFTWEHAAKRVFAEYERVLARYTSNAHERHGSDRSDEPAPAL